MQKLLYLIAELLQSLVNFLKGDDRWFLVIDEGVVAQEHLLIRQTQLEQMRVQAMRREDLNRRFESQRSVAQERLTFLEIWATLNPMSVFKFLRYSLSDVV